MRKWLPFFAALLLLLCAAPSIYDTASANASAVPADLDAQIDVWAAGLSKQPGFQALPEAERRISALGPGTHGWLVTFHAAGRSVGYMIIHAVESGGYRLTEYGAGGGHPFSPAVLRQGLSNLEAPLAEMKKPFRTERLYINAMLAAWRISFPGRERPPVYLDAYNGEELPITDGQWQTAVLQAEKSDAKAGPSASPGRSQKAVARALEISSFDPYERLPWLTKQPLKLKGPSGDKLLQSKLKAGKQLRLAAEKFDGQWLSVLPVVGLHEWDNGESYVAVDDRVARYTPFRDVQLHASIYD
ncbi:MAG TPA: hypothetical protein VMS09_15995 [Paenibacillus sp.]|uniref:hypothetical protein n=1 Tax=Paenibacillus sp. TaxID=58172 RepID=UPI002BC0574B|nr:hypothetical protein [Paenibacillus sp.]HUC93496.1 hypothetical protein [Paenibacillus sp.]